MQDLHSIGVGGGGGGGGGGRFFGGGGLDRRMRVHGHLAQQALKCPRCDSLNTKFCYYNNYNLSQPRHFCKACRRYWTKGGVLRSVPVGGGCRKTKRSKSRSSAEDGSRERKSKAQSPSSTDSSSLAAATTSAAVAEEELALSAAASESATKYGFSGTMFYNSNPPANLSFDDHGQEQLINPSGSTDCQIFPEVGSFDGLMASSHNAASMVGFRMADVTTTSYDRMQRQAPPAADNPGPELDVLKMQDRNSDGLTAALDWGSCGGGDQSLFDLTAALDPSYWSQPQWTDSDHSLPYLPYSLSHRFNI